MKLRHALTTAVLSAALTAGTGLLPPAASAATACVHDNSTGHTWCHNVYAAPVFDGNTNGSRIIGYMYTTYSWFGCRTDDGSWIGGPHPYRWIYTEADNGQWGMMRDTDIYDETDTVPYC
jgi:hypothetical protein